MSDVVTLARAALLAAAGGPAVVVVTRLPEADTGTRGRGDAGSSRLPVASCQLRRMLIYETGEVVGSLGSGELDAVAAELARAARAAGDARTVTVEHAGEKAELFVELHEAPPELLIVGAGHIAVPLAELGVLLGFQVTVLDDREEFASAERFPESARVLRVDFADPFRDVQLGPRTHVALVTRAHKYDYDCLRRLLENDTELAYIGMIGSRRRTKAAFQALLDSGVPRERLERVRAPVGLDIGAETPQEVALSIAAELVRVRRLRTQQGVVSTLAEKERVLERLMPQR